MDMDHIGLPEVRDPYTKIPVSVIQGRPCSLRFARSKHIQSRLLLVNITIHIAKVVVVALFFAALW